MTSSEATDVDIHERLRQLYEYRNTRLSGDEKGESQLFLDRMFRAFGHLGIREAGATLEYRVQRNNQKGTAFSDLMWKPRCLIEMKKAGTDLSKHYRQAFEYWMYAVPDRPRWVVLCNFDEFWIYDFDQQLDEPMDRVPLAELSTRFEALSFLLPEIIEPDFKNNLVAVTRDAAANMARLFRSLAARDVDRKDAQKFTLQCVMAMFAEDIGLLPGPFFTQALRDAKSGADCYDLIGGLFREMNTPGLTQGGRYKGTELFNGGLFKPPVPQELTDDELELLREAAQTDWSQVRPEIFGTLFEGSMDATERHAHGAHFTSQADIARIIGPTIVEPFREKIAAARDIAELESLQMQMANFRVLDPACGSGNFLYVAYREMRRLEQQILARIDDRRRSGLAAQSGLSFISTDHFFGMDTNPFAVEVAKVTMMLAKKLASDELGDGQQVLPLENLDGVIRCADALFEPWPQADVIVGNPPYLGRRKMQKELGAEYTTKLAIRYPEIGGVSDFVTYWFPLAHRKLPIGGRAGFVATDSIRENASRAVSLDYIVDHGGTIFDAVSSQAWSGDAHVNVSIVNWVKGKYPQKKRLWLQEAQQILETDYISSALSPKVDVRSAKDLPKNKAPKSCYQGVTPGVVQAFVIGEQEARNYIESGEGGCLFPYSGGSGLLDNESPREWLIDIAETDLMAARLRYPAVMKHLEMTALPVRERAAREQAEANSRALSQDSRAKVRNHHAGFLDSWWQLSYRRADMVSRLATLSRYVAVPRYQTEARTTVALFVDGSVRLSDQTNVFPFADEYSLGIISSSLHRAWLEGRCSTLGVALRYTSTTVWSTFPWPQRPSEAAVAAVGDCMAEILCIRDGYAKQGISLEKMYDALKLPGSSTLRRSHQDLDRAVMAAYGFDEKTDPLEQLLALNHSVALDVQATAPGPVCGASRLTDFALDLVQD